jgi:hypothetical protein
LAAATGMKVLPSSMRQAIFPASTSSRIRIAFVRLRFAACPISIR